jgi:hypothetical protein
MVGVFDKTLLHLDIIAWRQVDCMFGVTFSVYELIDEPLNRFCPRQPHSS